MLVSCKYVVHLDGLIICSVVGVVSNICAEFENLYNSYLLDLDNGNRNNHTRTRFVNDTRASNNKTIEQSIATMETAKRYSLLRHTHTSTWNCWCFRLFARHFLPQYMSMKLVHGFVQKKATVSSMLSFDKLRTCLPLNPRYYYYRFPPFLLCKFYEYDFFFVICCCF